MTQIHISIRKPKTGGLAPVTGVMRSIATIAQ